MACDWKRSAEVSWMQFIGCLECLVSWIIGSYDWFCASCYNYWETHSKNFYTNITKTYHRKISCLQSRNKYVLNTVCLNINFSEWKQHPCVVHEHTFRFKDNFWCLCPALGSGKNEFHSSRRRSLTPACLFAYMIRGWVLLNLYLPVKTAVKVTVINVNNLMLSHDERWLPVDTATVRSFNVAYLVRSLRNWRFCIQWQL